MAESVDNEQEIRRTLDVVQSMIDISAERLEGLRTQCSTSAELTQQEIRDLEGKIIKLYSKQLLTKEKLTSKALRAEMKHFASLHQWLSVVGLNLNSIETLCSKTNSLESLREKSEEELSKLFGDPVEKYEGEITRLCRALNNLRRYMELIARGEPDRNDLMLYWDSWDNNPTKNGQSPQVLRYRVMEGSLPSEDSIPFHNSFQGIVQSISAASLSSSTPPNTPLLKNQKLKFCTTPPSSKRHQVNTDESDVFVLPKSKSHEFHGGSRIENGDTATSFKTDQQTLPLNRRTRLPTEPGLYSSSDFSGDSIFSNKNSPIKSPPYKDSDDNVFIKGTVTSLQVPKSPRTPTVTRGMGHLINHRFTKTFKVMTTCDFCEKQMFIGLKCKECKYKCHRDCESKVPPSCGLPQELFDEFKRSVQADSMSYTSPVLNKPGLMSPNHHNSSILPSIIKRDRSRITPDGLGADSSSNTSSCNSSTPSSPALLLGNVTQTPQVTKTQFHFPEVNIIGDKGVTLETRKLEGATLSSDSDRTISVSGSGSVSTDSDKTPVRVDSQDSQVSDGDGDNRWPRQNSLSMREWEIPYDELKIGEPIGKGRFGTVYRGNWHGDVAIRVLNVEHYLDNDDQSLEAFKLEVATFRKTRHENLILFMGACMKPRRLAIVTSMSKGMTLYTRIHLHKDKFNMNNTVSIAQQISQGMGYLHARGIVHKDLRSKNIFLENGKVVIADFGLFSVTKLCYGNRTGNGLNIPRGWLCYLAPEIVKKLKSQQNRNQEELPFTAASDVYAFGTVWYELLCGEWPFKGQPPESVIWQVGRGMKQSLANLQASRDVKDILMRCWSYHADKRPDFSNLLTTLEKLPRKRLARSPSHPIHLSRSAESVF